MKNLYKIASVLALLIGSMTIIAGSKILLGIDTKNYVVLNWLVLYNVVVGFISIMASFLIWKNTAVAKITIKLILAAHTIIAVYLFFFSETVANESIGAMTFRVSIWIVIYLLTLKK